MDFLIQQLRYNGKTQHELLLQKSLQFNFKATAIGIYDKITKTYLYVFRNISSF